MRRVKIFLFVFTAAACFSQLIQPADLQYLGAFRLPEVSGDSDWNYSGNGSAYYPPGDPAGPDDGTPGSIFAIGHDQQQFISEISIPVPKISKARNPADLNTAGTLQPFRDVKGNMFGELEIPRADIEYLGPQKGQTAGKIHFCWGQHMQYELVPSHGWCETTLSNPNTAGPWFFDGHLNFTTNDYLFEIPEAWSNANTPGRRLASGRFRDGGLAGYGPALFAYGPWQDGNPPQPNAVLQSVTTLLLYGEHAEGVPEIQVSDDKKMIWYSPTDEWSGGAWLEAGGHAALVFAGTKSMGRNWYGFSDGTEYPTDGQGPFPPVPPHPHDQRGWWADSIQAQILFYNPQDLAGVAQGEKKPYEPQPYAYFNLNPYLFDSGYDYERDKMTSLGDCCYDRVHNLLYVFERLADEDRSLVHVFRINDSGTGVRGSGFGDRGSGSIFWDSEYEGRESGFGDRGSGATFQLMQNYPNPYNPETTIRFVLKEPDRVLLKVFDLRGREVFVLADAHYPAGDHAVLFDAKRLPGGIYLYRIRMGGFTASRKMAYLK